MKRLEIRFLGQGRCAVRFDLGAGVSLYEAYEGGATPSTHVLRLMVDGHSFGEVSSRRLPMTIRCLPNGLQKWILEDAYHAVYDSEAYALIVRAFPEADIGVRSMGGIVLWSPR